MSIKISNNACHFSELPFLWRPLANYASNEFPQTLPLDLIYDASAQLLTQRFVPEIFEFVKKSYETGAFFEGLMDDTGIGLDYAKDFLEFIDRAIGLKNLASKDVLEIGCGTGYLLYRLKGYGAREIGFEPGYSKLGKYPVNVIPNFFPSEEVRGRQFDLILAYALLEHMENPKDLLENMFQSIQENGVVIVSVPDCESHVQKGDPSMIIHEHFSYFTRAALRFLFESNGYETIVVSKSSFGGSIYGAFKKRKGSPKPAGQLLARSDYFKKMGHHLETMAGFFNSQRNKTVGIYVPVRALNTLCILKDVIKVAGIKLRFFDDSHNLHGKCFPAFDIRIENQSDLVNDPCPVILIFSYSFGKKIADRLKEKLPYPCAIFSLENF